MVFDNVKVGDRFRPKFNSLGGVITVTRLTSRGFEYTVETPYHAFPARYGPSLVTGGELLTNRVLNDVDWDAQYERDTDPVQLEIPL